MGFLNTDNGFSGTSGGGGGGGTAFAIQTLNCVEGTQEIGATLSTPNFTASYNKAVASASIVDNQGNPSADVSATPTTFDYVNDYTKTANNAAVTFSLHATSGAESANRAVTVAWRPYGYWGVGIAGLSTEGAIKALANRALMTSRGITFTLAPGAGEYMYYAYPTAYGAGTFFVAGWEGGFDLISNAISLTINGVAQSYSLYRSTNANLGSTTVQVT